MVSNRNTKRLFPDEDSSSEDDLSNSKEYKETPEKVIEEKKIEVSFDKENKENNAKKKKKIDEKKRRRRSSAKFLHLSGNRQNENDDSMDGGKPMKEHDQEKLSLMYKKALRMNAENRINVGNTWSLGLIDHLDKFLEDDDDTEMNLCVKSYKKAVDKEKRINFTKASVTLDASVKIYSYRVDDTHLSSYKVLANLNRTDNGKSQDVDGPVRTKNVQKNRGGGGGDVDTLESNIDTLNVNKLEQEYDVDPLFHKMSKTFDEGGAKGLLLVNLGVSSNGCNILFDNSVYKDEKKVVIEEKVVDDDLKADTFGSEEVVDGERDEIIENIDNEEKVEETGGKEETEGNDTSGEFVKESNDEISTPPPDVDTSPFVSKLKELLNGQHIAVLPLVPQLVTLREDLTTLEKEGYVADNPTPKKSKRYATDPEEEEEAERSIHQDALERSRMSACNLTYDASVMDFSGFGGNDVFDDGIDDIDNDVSQVFSGLDFSVLDSNNEFSSNTKTDELVDKMASKQQKCTGRMLDLICKSNLIGVETDYQFFNDALLQKMSSGNFWAGANHWKRSRRVDFEKKEKEPEEKVKKKRSTKVRTFIDFFLPNASTLESLIDQALNKKGKSKELQFSATTMSTQLKNDYILPLDAGIGIEQMGQLFLRKATIKSADKKSAGKHVGFKEDLNDTMFYGGDNHHDDEVDGYDGGGFALSQNEADFGDYENYQSQSDDVRKVNKIEVKYATVSKKVDVKRLKCDLWSELEVSTGMKSKENKDYDGEMKCTEDDPLQNDANNSPMDDSSKNEEVKSEIVSFKETVDKIDASQSQNGVTLPFYFICLLHLANEKGLRLDSPNLHDIMISADDGTLDATLSPDPTSKGRKTRKKKVQYAAESDAEDDDIDEM